MLTMPNLSPLCCCCWKQQYLVLLLLTYAASVRGWMHWDTERQRYRAFGTVTPALPQVGKEVAGLQLLYSTSTENNAAVVLDNLFKNPFDVNANHLSQLDAHHRFRVPKKGPLSLPHLFRHFDDISFDSYLRCADPEEFLTSLGYSHQDLPSELWEAPVHEVIAPHVRFLVDVFKAGSGRLGWVDDEVAPTSSDGEECEVSDVPHHNVHLQPEARQVIPPSFFRCSIERTVAPWHAYLQHHKLPHGPELFHDTEKWHAFCNVCDSGSVAKFAHLCEEWSASASTEQQENIHHTVPRIQAFCRAFRRGLLPAVRCAQQADLEAVNCTPSQMVDLLLLHGANYLKKDKHGVSLLHWAAGVGHLSAVQGILHAIAEERYPPGNPFVPPEEGPTAVLMESRDAKDGATPLHWAACGFAHQAVGVGGSVEVCSWMLDQAKDQRKELANVATWSSSTPLMWAAWSGSLDVAKLLLEAGADPLHCNRRKQNAVHWAAAAGQLEVCQLLLENMGREQFEKPDDFGRTPLDYALLFNHDAVARWLRGLDSKQ